MPPDDSSARPAKLSLIVFSGDFARVHYALATAAAGIIVGVVAMGLGGLITEVIDVLSGGNIFLLLVITAIASLIIGMGLPTTATYIVMASLTAPSLFWMPFTRPSRSMPPKSVKRAGISAPK